MHHQLQRCAGYTLLHSTFPELALFWIFACIQHQIPVGLFASLDNTDRYYLPLFFYPDRYYKHPNFDEKHSKCNFKPAKEAIRLQKKILLCKSTMLFHLHLLSGKSNASFTKSGFYPNTRKHNSLCGSTLLNSIGKKIHTLPRCGLVTIQVARHILCSIRSWCTCGFDWQGVCVFFYQHSFAKR